MSLSVSFCRGANAQEPEYILADFVDSLQHEGLLRLRVLGPTSATPLEITHPEDADLMRQQVAALGPDEL